MNEKKYPSHTLDKFMLRFPEGMRDRIKKEAEMNERSMNSEIIYRLEKSLKADESSHHSAPELQGAYEPVSVDDISEEMRMLSKQMEMIGQKIQNLTK